MSQVHAPRARRSGSAGHDGSVSDTRAAPPSPLQVALSLTLGLQTDPYRSKYTMGQCAARDKRRPRSCGVRGPSFASFASVPLLLSHGSAPAAQPRQPSSTLWPTTSKTPMATPATPTTPTSPTTWRQTPTFQPTAPQSARGGRSASCKLFPALRGQRAHPRTACRHGLLF